ncbi:MAG: hypothetical protein CM15mP85_24530 [Rhodobacterales bacterium]|nr:MAG: hypothetical protein CM15mP85_24530 [Rhodobacterales bacterium]
MYRAWANGGAYLAEIKSWIMSVEKGPGRASRAVGMNWRERVVSDIASGHTKLPPFGQKFKVC